MSKTMVVGSQEHRDQRKAEVKKRFDRATDEIADETLFSPDQIAALRNAFMLLRWAVEEAI